MPSLIDCQSWIIGGTVLWVTAVNLGWQEAGEVVLLLAQAGGRRLQEVPTGSSQSASTCELIRSQIPKKQLFKYAIKPGPGKLEMSIFACALCIEPRGILEGSACFSVCYRHS